MTFGGKRIFLPSAHPIYLSDNDWYTFHGALWHLYISAPDIHLFAYLLTYLLTYLLIFFCACVFLIVSAHKSRQLPFTGSSLTVVTYVAWPAWLWLEVHWPWPYILQICVYLLLRPNLSPPNLSSRLIFIKICMIFVTPRFRQDADCVHAPAKASSLNCSNLQFTINIDKKYFRLWPI